MVRDINNNVNKKDTLHVEAAIENFNFNDIINTVTEIVIINNTSIWKNLEFDT